MNDDAIRAAAFDRMARLTRVHGRVLTWAQVSATIAVNSEQVFLANQARGIHKPRQMLRGALSIKTTVPRTGRIARYDDLTDDSAGGWFEYRFQGTDPYNHDNTCLREAWEDRTPLIYLFGIAPHRYEPLWPVFITAWNPKTLTARVQVQPVTDSLPLNSSVGADVGAQPSGSAAPELVSFAREPIAREYATYEAKARLHQDAFRDQVLDAYEGRCAVCRFPRSELLDAAHIIEDRDERGVPEVPNGLCLCRLHHAAFDRLLIGIRPDGRIELDQRLRDTRDGPTLEHGFLRFADQKIHFPANVLDRPRPEYLEQRFDQFLAPR